MASWASRAALNALLRYRPERDALQELQRAAEQRYGASVAAGRSEGTLALQQAQNAIPEDRALFGRVRQEGERARALGDAGVTPGSPFAQAAANETASGAERLGQTEAHTMSDVRAQKIAAAELPAFTQQAALGELLKELTTLSGRKQKLAGAEGLAAQTESQRLEENARKEAGEERRDERKEAGDERRSKRSSQTSRANSEESNKQKREAAEGKRNGKPAVTPKEQRAAAGTIAQIRQYAGKSGELSRAQRVTLLTEPLPEEKITNKKGESEKTPGRKGFTPNVLMSAALDWTEYGHLSRATERRLSHEGYDVTKLGVPRAPRRSRNPAERAAEEVTEGIKRTF